MTTVQKGANEEPWYHQIVKNFAFPKDADLNAQASTDVTTCELTNLGVGPESKKKKRASTATAAPKKFDTLKVDVLKEEKKKGTRLVSEPWCDYVVVSDTLEGLAPVVVRKPKAEPRDTADIPVSNADDPTDLESCPEPLLRTKAVKRKQLEGEAATQPAKKITRKKIGKKGNLDALAAKLSPEACSIHLREPSSIFNDDLPPSPPRASIKEQLEGTKTVEAEVEKAMEVEKPVEVMETEEPVEAETIDGVTKPKPPEVVAHGQEKGKSILEEEVLVITIPSSATTSAPPRDRVEENPVDVDQGFIAHDEEEDSPIRPDETLGDYYYRTYSEKRASEIHAPVWKVKQGDTFSDWQVCRD
ncbi:hypothetical protein HanRHA438_Chr03g0111631 [Helianthus annuus]|uniref:Uncharacterized protein n=1 Tax=Helianthus annuus TaxID=4232 RepID=A0A9K3JEF8_HELAN|nr:hypothetical protein HanXRQr2_Chr03g0100531 [Helianthus annuus]KAJ0592330.1 hypothetical protein HanHA300_Chr03g0083771 [Helianthus annuus]KAJ0599848.1 hypothetical protein HanIR_Chr03g0109761 [Helianthus annuus]KAJ0607317.1 hypothetical protein HanHA89_Chr03g0095281 [Helianthus annuus]KAJ0767376.1 hypothetical protein HanLR1_Chr03g0088571 [Helianthus annuus]